MHYRQMTEAREIVVSQEIVELKGESKAFGFHGLTDP